MNTRLNNLYRASMFLMIWVLMPSAFAEPHLALRTGQPCAACHVNPTGGGMRNSYGAYYGAQELPARPGAITAFDGGQVSDSFRVGSNLRFNMSQVDFDEGAEERDARGFNTQTGQLYIALQPEGSRFMLYLDQQLAPGGGRNREAFVMAQLGDNHSLKAGSIMLNYGLRLEDDTAFVRQASGFNFNNNDQGVELGLNFDRLRVDLALSNGTSGQNNNDRHFQYLTRGEYLGDGWRAGANYLFNEADTGRREVVGVFGGLNFLDYLLMFEFTRIDDDSNAMESQVQEVSLVELNRRLAQGYNLKLTTEWLDPDTAIDENERVRHSVLLEYTPYAHIQVRGGIRVGDDIPQRPIGNFTRGFVQLHWYY